MVFQVLRALPVVLGSTRPVYIQRPAALEHDRRYAPGGSFALRVGAELLPTAANNQDEVVTGEPCENVGHIVALFNGSARRSGVVCSRPCWSLQLSSRGGSGSFDTLDTL